MRKRGAPSHDRAASHPPGREGGGAQGGWYARHLQTDPIKTKAITLGILNFVGDLVTQLFVEKSGQVDFRRLAAMTSLGLFIVGPILHYWYGFLNRVVKAPGTKGVLIRLSMDQFIFAPIFIAFTFAYLLLMEGNAGKIQQKIQSDWKPTLFANWKLWIPFQFCNFMFVPPILQVLFSNVVGLVWNVYISYASHTPAGGASNKQVSRLQQNIVHVAHEPLRRIPDT
ncbi:hypothetical protein M758_9G146900 [Ceratodon purpureus]|uniref:Uncharacterized protein n=1 Tax=Ceratodon purpureus TaxID=3225 RepID=A0A8T0GVR4_CERPU|nr:hypothetical protein KC19_9G144500 [Ceratodon purpureus]KAG0606511.1 hypothetical protein M758_9G146900 [Ceratodon purpureus]